METTAWLLAVPLPPFAPPRCGDASFFFPPSVYAHARARGGAGQGTREERVCGTELYTFPRGGGVGWGERSMVEKKVAS